MTDTETTTETVKVHITNDYSDGHHSESTVDVQAPESAADLDDDNDEYDGENWWWGIVYEHTGDGHGNGDFGKLGSCYTATIIEASDPELVNREYEWCD